MDVSSGKRNLGFPQIWVWHVKWSHLTLVILEVRTKPVARFNQCEQELLTTQSGIYEMHSFVKSWRAAQETKQKLHDHLPRGILEGTQSGGGSGKSSSWWERDSMNLKGICLWDSITLVSPWSWGWGRWERRLLEIKYSLFWLYKGHHERGLLFEHWSQSVG